MGILIVLFYGIFAVLPLGVIIRVQIIPSVYVYPIDLLLMATFLYSTYFAVAKEKNLSFRSPLFLFMLVGLIALIINLYWLNFTQFIISSLYLVRFLMYTMSMGNLLFLTKEKQKNILTVMIFSLFLTVLIGIVQYFLYPSLRNLYYAGWDEHLYRLFSTFLDPNFASAIFVCLIWLLVYKLRSVPFMSWKYALYAGMTLVSVVSLLLTYSRTGFLMIIVSAVIYLFLIKQRKWVLVVLLLLSLSIVLLPKNMPGEGVKLLRTKSITDRLETFHDAVVIWKTSPLYGVGFNALRYAKEKEGLIPQHADNLHSGAGISNSYLFVLATTGIIGLGVFLFFLYCIGKEIYIFKQKHAVLGESILAIYSAILVGSLSENIFFYPFILIIFFALFAVVKSTGDTKP